MNNNYTVTNLGKDFINFIISENDFDREKYESLDVCWDKLLNYQVICIVKNINSGELLPALGKYAGHFTNILCEMLDIDDAFQVPDTLTRDKECVISELLDCGFIVKN